MDDQLNPLHVEWFKSRGISKETLIKSGIYTGKRGLNGGNEVLPCNTGEMIVFPFIVQRKKVNEKYRWGKKLFAQSPGGQMVFWNADCLSDPLLASGDAALVITEGEIDALSFIEAGYPWVVSVPDGAPMPRNDRWAEEIDHDDDKAYG